MRTKRRYLNLGLMALAVVFIIILTGAVKLFSRDNAHQKYLNEHYPSVIRLAEILPGQSDRCFVLTPEEKIVNVTVTHSDKLFRAVWCSSLQNMFMVEIFDACAFSSDPDFSSKICLQKNGGKLRIRFIDEDQVRYEETKSNKSAWDPWLWKNDILPGGYPSYFYGIWNPGFYMPYDNRYNCNIEVPYRPVTKEDVDAFIKALAKPWEEFEVHPGIPAPVYE